MILALVFGTSQRAGLPGVADILKFWTKGFWELLSFSMQMVLILLFGYMLALSPLLDALSTKLTGLSKNPVRGTVILVLISLAAGLINWGLALVFGAVLVRKIAVQARLSGNAINYPLMGASAYICMMIWHGGLSGSAPLSVASQGHFLVDKTGVIPLSGTIFSTMNLYATAMLFTLLPLITWRFAKKGEMKIPSVETFLSPSDKGLKEVRWKPTFFTLFGLLMLSGIIIKTCTDKESSTGLNEINLILFSLVMIAFPDAGKLSKAAGEAIGSTTGIIIQFPLYAGIMGIMKYSGLLVVMTEWFVNISTKQTLPLFSFVSASLVNLFVPSGGGQWAVQGPVIIEAANMIGVSPAKEVMALAYGDQLTNMLQPFWALPLLGITGLKAGEIFRYSVPYMFIGLLIFSLVLCLHI
jgi:short-chain fatty acids transporter